MDTHLEPELEGECAAAWRATRLFVTGGADAPERTRAMRAHFDRCGECRDRYRAAVMTCARIGRERRHGRRRGEREQRRARLRRMAREAGLPPATSWSRIRMLLYPALAMLLIALVARGPQAAAHLHWVRGEVAAGRLRLGAGDGMRPVESGATCRTGADGHARLVAGRLVADLEARTTLELESARPARLRLQSGGLWLSGSATVVTPRGVVELQDGRARVVLAAGLEVDCESGQVRIGRADGERSLGPGDRFPCEPADDGRAAR